MGRVRLSGPGSLFVTYSTYYYSSKGYSKVKDYGLKESIERYIFTLT